ncbi:GFA family protein [Aestuariivirga litoralis]|uniref:GFA family protein n=1 Tax=Aestuariivirga litoralis TaxID=2650924 RepID=UPI0018C56332|nr:GFA family protein [Aestuariivirga litoralis]MBG1231193.1 GFA family protein [Aestuariivirga litoralis]
MPDPKTTGGCQCGALRYAFEGKPGSAEICHCRMCQKAFGNFGAALFGVDVARFEWTMGQPSVFRSSPPVQRGFCRKCGTPMFMWEDGDPQIELAAGTLDDPSVLVFTAQVGVESRLPWFAHLHELPEHRTDESRPAEELARLVSRQHPDHKT